MWVEAPILNGSTVVGWDTQWNAKRPFALDMAAFAIHLKLILAFPNTESVLPHLDIGSRCSRLRD